MNNRKRVSVVAMPWTYQQMPSLQLGMVTAILQRCGTPVRPISGFLYFLEYLFERTMNGAPSERFTFDDYARISEGTWLNGLGEWIFAVPPFNADVEARDRAYLQYAKRRIDPTLVEVAQVARRHVDGFLRLMVDVILAEEPDIVGFTSTFNQNVASLNLARRVKDARPEVTIMFGGANCEGEMGQGLHEAFPFIDIVVRGEAEYALPATVAALNGDGDLDAVPGIVFRRDGRTIVNASPASAAVSMNDVPAPEFGEYFEHLRASPLRSQIDPLVALPVESSRGCWWGEKHHCTFCGLNGSSIAFRSKDPVVFAAEIDALARTYRRTKFQPVDNILDLRYFKTLLPWLKQTRDAGNDWTFFYEVKSNLKKEQVAALAESGVTWIQPGIESMSSQVLRLMDKGVTALQNIRLLKWAAEYGIRVSWNMIYGFPGETAADYKHVYDLLPSLSHFAAPSIVRLLLERFSPYYDRHADYGIEIIGAARFYNLIYELPEERLMQIAYLFEYRATTLEPNAVIPRLRERVAELWHDGVASSLRLVRGAGFITIYERRAGIASYDLTLSGVSAEIYMACDGGMTAAALAERFAHVSRAQIDELLDTLLVKRLVYEEGGVYLSLATSTRPVLNYLPQRAPDAERELTTAGR